MRSYNLHIPERLAAMQIPKDQIVCHISGPAARIIVTDPE
jgi:hypothetical protein